MAYRALYREYRPKCFSDMVGQDQITSVLKNQISSGKTTHAYLFCGTRGTGKTTAARILARTLNCLEPVKGEACGHCDACRFALSDNCPDIVEIDAASNNGVDNVRDLIETCNIAPLKLNKRVVIIDEVHMLSSSAFNALLKTLEEPPAHLVFILATTEPHKLLATIVSRCQRFDFHRIGIPDIIKNLSGILNKIGARVEDDGLLQIARSANGGMRDALSLLDQCLSFCGDNLSTEDVYNVLGNMEESYMLSISRSLLDAKADKAILELDSVIQKGRDLNVFVNDLANTFRSLLVLKTCGEGASNILDLSSETLKKYSLVCENASTSHILMAMRLLLELQNSIKYSPAPRTLIETEFIRIAKPEKQHTLEALEARIDMLERKLQEGSFASVSTQNQSFVPISQPDVTVPHPSSGDRGPETDKKEESSIVSQTVVSTASPKPEAAPVSSVSVYEQPAISETPSPGKGADTSDYFSIWNSLLALLLKDQPLIHSLASKGIPLSFEENRLTVGFTEDNSVCFATCSSPRMLSKVNALIASIIPGSTVSFIKYTAKPIDSKTEQKMKEMFGDKLEITNE